VGLIAGVLAGKAAVGHRQGVEAEGPGARDVAARRGTARVAGMRDYFKEDDGGWNPKVLRSLV